MPWGQRAHYKEMTDNRARAAVCHLHSAHALVSLCSKRRDDVNKRERGCFPTMTYTKETQETMGFPETLPRCGPQGERGGARLPLRALPRPLRPRSDRNPVEKRTLRPPPGRRGRRMVTSGGPCQRTR